MPHRIRFYDRDGRGIRLPDGWSLDLGQAVPALVSGTRRVALPFSVRAEHPDLEPEALKALVDNIEGAEWLT